MLVSSCVFWRQHPRKAKLQSKSIQRLAKKEQEDCVQHFGQPFVVLICVHIS